MVGRSNYTFSESFRLKAILWHDFHCQLSKFEIWPLCWPLIDLTLHYFCHTSGHSIKTFLILWSLGKVSTSICHMFPSFRTHILIFTSQQYPKGAYHYTLIQRNHTTSLLTVCKKYEIKLDTTHRRLHLIVTYSSKDWKLQFGENTLWKNLNFA